jgi:hypothetical protein
VNATGKERLRTGARWLLAAAFVTTGALHFSATDAFLRVMPPYLPHPRALVLVSGAAEIAGALGVLVPGVVRQLAGWGLILLLRGRVPGQRSHGPAPRSDRRAERCAAAAVAAPAAPARAYRVGVVVRVGGESVGGTVVAVASGGAE